MKDHDLQLSVLNKEVDPHHVHEFLLSQGLIYTRCYHIIPYLLSACIDDAMHGRYASFYVNKGIRVTSSGSGRRMMLRHISMISRMLITCWDIRMKHISHASQIKTKKTKGMGWRGSTQCIAEHSIKQGPKVLQSLFSFVLTFEMNTHWVTSKVRLLETVWALPDFFARHLIEVNWSSLKMIGEFGESCQRPKPFGCDLACVRFKGELKRVRMDLLFNLWALLRVAYSTQSGEVGELWKAWAIYKY